MLHNRVMLHLAFKFGHSFRTLGRDLEMHPPPGGRPALAGFDLIAAATASSIILSPSQYQQNPPPPSHYDYASHNLRTHCLIGRLRYTSVALMASSPKIWEDIAATVYHRHRYYQWHIHICHHRCSIVIVLPYSSAASQSVPPRVCCLIGVIWISCSGCGSLMLIIHGVGIRCWIECNCMHRQCAILYVL